MSLAGKKIVLGITGSIAAYKTAELIRTLVKAGAEVQPILTVAAARFISPLTLGTLARREALISLWPEAGPSGDATLWTRHVEIGLWADGIVVAPATAQTLAKMASGACDSMLTAVLLSARCPVLVAPAMDHDMWHHPATQRNIRQLEEDGIAVLPPASGELASGLIGDGRLPEPAEIAEALGPWLASASTPEASGEDKEGNQTLSGTTVLVTAGPTREALDPVRFLSNGSTGTMGFEIAREAARRGAEVTLLAGPVALETPEGVTRIDITSADDLYAAAMEHAGADLIIAAAAVSDYTPEAPSDQKLKKGDGDLHLRLRRTPDVLAALGAQKRKGQTLVGFALETHDGEANARGKLNRKQLDWIVLNIQGEPGAGFGTETNRVVLLGRDGRNIPVEMAPKREIARRILDTVATSPA